MKQCRESADTPNILLLLKNGTLNKIKRHIPNMKIVENPSLVVLDCTFTIEFFVVYPILSDCNSMPLGARSGVLYLRAQRLPRCVRHPVRCAVAVLCSKSTLVCVQAAPILLKGTRMLRFPETPLYGQSRYLRGPLPFSIGRGLSAYKLPWSYLAKAVLAVFCRQCGFTLAGTAFFIRELCTGVYLFRPMAFTC